MSSPVDYDVVILGASLSGVLAVEFVRANHNLNAAFVQGTSYFGAENTLFVPRTWSLSHEGGWDHGCNVVYEVRERLEQSGVHLFEAPPSFVSMDQSIEIVVPQAGSNAILLSKAVIFADPSQPGLSSSAITFSDDVLGLYLSQVLSPYAMIEATEFIGRDVLVLGQGSEWMQEVAHCLNIGCNVISATPAERPPTDPYSIYLRSFLRRGATDGDWIAALDNARLSGIQGERGALRCVIETLSGPNDVLVSMVFVSQSSSLASLNYVDEKVWGAEALHPHKVLRLASASGISFGYFESEIAHMYQCLPRFLEGLGG